MGDTGTPRKEWRNHCAFPRSACLGRIHTRDSFLGGRTAPELGQARWPTPAIPALWVFSERAVQDAEGVTERYLHRVEFRKGEVSESRLGKKQKS